MMKADIIYLLHKFMKYSTLHCVISSCFCLHEIQYMPLFTGTLELKMAMLRMGTCIYISLMQWIGYDFLKCDLYISYAVTVPQLLMYVVCARNFSDSDINKCGVL